ncbi:hypothetical protein ABZ345_32585 [Lentzea sp. NPDC005914]|uniref:hypothetical protein n=1 Tax=Lentzea sp. NPDC005914 TaxID=3154572 RepID=UPI0033E91B36
MTSVTFRVDLVVSGEPVTLSETELSEEHAAELARECVGAIVIDTGDNTLEVADDLTAAVFNLCLRGPAALLDDPHGHFLYRASLATRHVVMIPLGDAVRVFGEQTPVANADRAVLLPALFRCGQRLIELLDRTGDPDEAALTVGDLRAAATDTGAALRRHGLID